MALSNLRNSLPLTVLSPLVSISLSNACDVALFGSVPVLAIALSNSAFDTDPLPSVSSDAKSWSACVLVAPNFAATASKSDCEIKPSFCPTLPVCGRLAFAACASACAKPGEDCGGRSSPARLNWNMVMPALLRFAIACASGLSVTCVDDSGAEVSVLVFEAVDAVLAALSVVDAVGDVDCASACNRHAPLLFAIAETDTFFSKLDSDVPHPGFREMPYG